MLLQIFSTKASFVNTIVSGVLAVSYTHLDVYKRQGLEPVPIGSYRGFAMSLTVEDFGRDFVLTLKGRMNHRCLLYTSRCV